MADINNSTSEETNQEVQDDAEFVTMVDVLKEEQELEDDATAVLGASDEKNCTYSKGYLKRQALYACMTCIPEAKNDPMQRAGICLACSYNCHEGHELIELYTKRNFRCDCGNNKFPGKSCNLDGGKDEVNELNCYNHNFSGLYCTCERPYPDPEDTIADDMIQCIICEDWYHCRHLNVKIPDSHSYAEMICNECIKQHQFLLYYSGFSLITIKTEPEDDMKLDAESNNIDIDPNITIKNEPTHDTSCDENSILDSSESDISDCVMPKLRSEDLATRFWPDNWRQSLCTCENCKIMYEKENVSFLTDLQDTVHAYEEKGKAKALENSSESQYEQGMKALSSLDRTKQMEAIMEYNTMKEHLKAYLQKFADNKKIVREEDIREFFSTMAARKKQKIEIPYFCR